MSAIENAVTEQAPAPTLDELIRSAVELVITNATAHKGHTPEKLAEVIEFNLAGVEFQSLMQVFGSTTGPFGGYGGAAVTTMRVVSVRVSRWVVWHLDGKVAFVTQLGTGDNPDFVLEAWRYGSCPMYRDIATSVPDWCPSRQRSVR